MYKCINRAITLYLPRRFVKKKIQVLLQLHRHKHHTTPTTAYCLLLLPTATANKLINKKLRVKNYSIPELPHPLLKLYRL